MLVQIVIDAQTIENSVRGDSTKCLVANGVNQKLQAPFFATEGGLLGGGTLGIRKHTDKFSEKYPNLMAEPEFSAPLPPEAKQLVKAFELGQAVQPLTFEIEIPKRFLATA